MKTMNTPSDARTTDRSRWLGALVGSNLWILLLGLDVVLKGAATTGLVIVSAGVLASAGGWIAWRDRERIGMRNVMRGVLLCAGLAGFAAFFAIDLAGQSLVSLGYLPESTPQVLASGYPLLLTFPLLALFAR